MKACQCGCGALPKPGNKYIRFHHLPKGPKTYIPSPDETPSGICECGCGKPTKIWRHPTNIPARRFRGYPTPRLRGHANQSERVGEKNPGWKGGRHIASGYVAVHVPDHPNARSRGMILEHRLVMSEYLNRPLESNEIVHHKNGDKQDNRIENLELTTPSEHKRMHNLEDGRIPPSRLGFRKYHNYPE